MPAFAGKKVKSYKASWDADSHSGDIHIYWEEGTKYFQISDPSEFMAIIDLLRNEKPLYVRPEQSSKRIFTAVEIVGEEET